MIGVIAGEGSLPKVLIDSFLSKKKNFLVINLSTKKFKKKIFITLKLHNCLKL